MSSDAKSGISPRSPAMPVPATSSAALPLALSAAVLIAMGFGGWKWYQVRQFEIAKSEAIPATVIGPPLKDFELTERSGKSEIDFVVRKAQRFGRKFLLRGAVRKLGQTLRGGQGRLVHHGLRLQHAQRRQDGADRRKGLLGAIQAKRGYS